MRLDKFAAGATGASRSQVKLHIRSGRITVNGAPAAPDSTVDPARDEIALDGEKLALHQPAYIMLHKPAGVVSASRDADHPCVTDLIDSTRLPPAISAQQLQVAGRLDRDTTGLLLLTDDGAWNHRVTSPRSGSMKTYLATLADPVTDTDLEPLRQGVMLRGEDKPTLPAEATLARPDQVIIKISEGRYHQVKRMFAAIGNRVTALHRCAIGELALDPTLKPGDWRFLTPGETDLFRP